MSYSSTIFWLNAFLLAANTQAQSVGIGTSTPASAAALEVSATDKGLLPPRVAAASAIANPVQGLLVFQTNAPAGYYYYTGTAWTQLSPVGSAWTTTGNAGTAAGTNFLGTTDGQALVVKTNGSAATNERLRVQADGRVLVNRATAQNGDLFSVYGSGTTGALTSVSNNDFPINGYSSSANAGIYGENNGSGQGVLGFSSGTGVGVYGSSSNANGLGVFGYNQGAGVGLSGLSTSGVGVAGQTNSNTSPGIRGLNLNASGTGVLALGNNISGGTILAGGAGLAANGTSLGAYALATNATTGIGLVASGNGLTTLNNIGAGAGVLGQGLSFGVVGYAVNTLGNERWGGYFDFLNSTNGYAYVGGRTANTDYAILSSGTKSTMVPDEQGRNRVLYCTEAPEVLFQDFGSGQLRNGRAHIALDPLLARNVAISDQHPLRVFIQLEGDCRGVYVANKSAAGFDVVELGEGRSNVAFTWQLVANRADATDAQGRITSEFASLRFPVGPQRRPVQPQEATVRTAAPPVPALPARTAR